MTRLFYRFAYTLFLLTALGGCATTAKLGTVAKSCEPSTDQMTALEGALTSSADAAVAVATAEGLGFLACMLHQGANEIVSALTPKPGTAALELAGSSYSTLLPNATALLKKYP